MGFRELCGNMVALCYEPPPRKESRASQSKKTDQGGIKDNNSDIQKGMEYRELCGNTVALCYEDPQQGTADPPKAKMTAHGGDKNFHS